MRAKWRIWSPSIVFQFATVSKYSGANLNSPSSPPLSLRQSWFSASIEFNQYLISILVGCELSAGAARIQITWATASSQFPPSRKSRVGAGRCSEPCVWTFRTCFWGKEAKGLEGELEIYLYGGRWEEASSASNNLPANEVQVVSMRRFALCKCERHATRESRREESEGESEASEAKERGRREGGWAAESLYYRRRRRPESPVARVFCSELGSAKAWISRKWSEQKDWSLHTKPPQSRTSTCQAAC
ncbi:hypothetical protein HDV63DRAFT_46926 [Trichoderma sp. SZMC 28014]